MPPKTPSKTSAKRAPKKTKMSVSEQALPVVPMRGMVSFPFMVLPLFVGRDKSVRALEAASETGRMLVLVSQQDESVEEPGTDDLFTVGTLAEVMQMLKMPDGNVRVVVEGRERVRVREWTGDEPHFTAIVEPLQEEAAPRNASLQALVRRLKADFETAVGLSKNIPPEALQNAQNQDTPGALADLVVSYLEVPVGERQAILENLSPLERAKQVAQMLTQELEVLELDKELDSQVREGVNEGQREYFLRERMKAIQDKLGDRDSSFKEADQLRERVQNASMSDEARDKALSEISRLEKMPPIAPEVSVIRTYVELMCDLPWDKRTPDNLDIARAQEMLDEDHWALEKIKDRILEFLAVRKLNPHSKGPILCFVGPPGVGKTSIGKSIAKALGREFIRVSVGGIHDEAEIRGHRRTYIGSMPGRVISAIRRVGVKNPVFMLDEIDKLGRDFRGDPSSALLEALDPEQNTSFSDHYLEVPFDLSEVMFVATGNLLDPIPAALRDRLEVLRFPGYTENEKHAIARRYLVPKQMKENGVTEENIAFSDDGLMSLIRDYTREAGVRNLEREIGTVCRKIARGVAQNDSTQDDAISGDAAQNGAKLNGAARKVVAKGRKKKAAKAIEIVPGALHEYLGARKFIHGARQEHDEIGVAQGLAWTEVGGELMPIEVSLVAGKGATKLTGNLGSVMKESCEAAMTYARAHADELGITGGDWMRKHDAHIHVPAGAVPKDGPSAGVAVAVALVSALTGRAVRRELAMTGEISLRGRVLPVGGVKEKVLAAHRAGLREVMLPRENERDLDEIPQEVRDDLEFHLADNLEEAMQRALVAAEPARNEKAANNGVAKNGAAKRVKTKVAAKNGAA